MGWWTIQSQNKTHANVFEKNKRLFSEHGIDFPQEKSELVTQLSKNDLSNRD